MRSACAIGRPCALCGAPAEHLDHITPRSQGGTDHASNLQPLCRRCNLGKSDQ
jgi:5-methylcytosine-specific restriction endonuclease McrA